MRRSALFLAVIVFFAGEAGAAAGRVEFTVGGANIVGADGRTRPAERGTELDSGDTVRTADGRVQVRMTDGSYISLQPNTEFGIKNYRFEGKTDGSESAFYSLAKGAMRTVTGLIGRINRNRYQVATPTATVGIRGTGYVLQIFPDSSALLRVTSGIGFIANRAGSIDVPAGVSGLAPADPGRPPQETTQTPTASPNPATRQDFVQGDQRTTDGGLVITPPSTPPISTVLLSGSGYAATLVLGVNDIPRMTPPLEINTTATFDAVGQMTAVPNLQSRFFTLGAGGSHADFRTDGILAWGRWIGPVTGDYCGNCSFSEDYGTDKGLHYVIGIPTPTMPQTGPAIYTLLGATQPTYIVGGTPGIFSGELRVNFSSITTVTADFRVAMPDRTYGLLGSTTTSSASFLLAPVVSGCPSSSICSGSIQGFFAGPTAERAGVGYHINDYDPQLPLSKDVVGAAAFKR